jgi:glycosyltransferase involved in cell wall biosynthesis
VSDPLVSVVTPVFNGEDYLEECVQSVVRQTYRNWRYTIVDNASTDNTPDIAARFARLDARVSHARYEDFLDAIDNHNRAFDAVDPESEFCKLLQADDWIYPECLALKVKVAQESPTIGLVGAYRLSDFGVELSGLPYTRNVFDGRAILRRQLLGEPDVLGSPSSMFLRSRVVSEREPPFYKHPGWIADQESACWVLSRYDFGFVHQVLTYERRQGGRRLNYAMDMNTLAPEFICLHLVYGPLVLDPIEYRNRLRDLLRRYVWWHTRQLPRPSRLRQEDFFAIHEEGRRLILASGAEDRDVRLAMDVVAAFLSRGRLRRATKTGPAAGATTVLSPPRTDDLELRARDSSRGLSSEQPD